MSYFVVQGRDKRDVLAKRTETRESHRAHLRRSHDFGVHIHVAGPILDERGEMCGTILIVEADDKSEIQAFLERDPYVESDIFEELTVSAFSWGIGVPS